MELKGEDTESGCCPGFLAQAAGRKPDEQKQVVVFGCGVEIGFGPLL